MSQHVDFRRAARPLYSARSEVSTVVVPRMRFFALDGDGEPGRSPEYRVGTAALYAASQALRRRLHEDYELMPLERLRGAGSWTLLMRQPIDFGPPDAEHAFAVVAGKLRGEVPLRVLGYEEGVSAQVLHVGPQHDADLGRLDEHIRRHHGLPAGPAHEIFLDEPGQGDPARPRVLLRQPYLPRVAPMRR